MSIYINQWPPVRGRFIFLKKPGCDKLYIGQTGNLITVLNQQVCPVILMNDRTYVEPIFNAQPNYNLKPGILLLYPNYNWNYINDNNLINEINKLNYDKISYLDNIRSGYMNFIKENPNLYVGGKDNNQKPSIPLLNEEKNNDYQRLLFGGLSPPDSVHLVVPKSTEAKLAALPHVIASSVPPAKETKAQGNATEETRKAEEKQPSTPSIPSNTEEGRLNEEAEKQRKQAEEAEKQRQEAEAEKVRKQESKQPMLPNTEGNIERNTTEEANEKIVVDEKQPILPKPSNIEETKVEPNPPMPSNTEGNTEGNAAEEAKTVTDEKKETLPKPPIPSAIENKTEEKKQALLCPQPPSTKGEMKEEPTYIALGEKKEKNCTGIAQLKSKWILAETIENDNLNSLFTDNKVRIIFTDKKCKQELPKAKVMEEKRKELDTSKAIIQSQLIMPLDISTSIEGEIKTKSDEMSEGRKIIEAIKKYFNVSTNKLVSGLKLYVYNGYVHLVRKCVGCVCVSKGKPGLVLGQDKITKDLVGELKYFNWQCNLPIDYDTLKFILFHNAFQKELKLDKEQLKEAEKILSQEFLVALQPEPLYMIWCVTRLIECWYADIDMQNNIRKIKILINQFRARNDQKYNEEHGVLPSIIIYPRYGVKSAEIVMKKIYYYFWKYMRIGWNCSTPTYFIKVNELLYYTNGAIDLKLYYKNVLDKSNKSLENISFEKGYEGFKHGDKINVIEE
jgi:hypothetical protein